MTTTTSSSAFCRYDLRTTDVEGATSFYSQVLGDTLTASSSTLGVWPLHEQARARGAPPHWLGQIGVPDVEPVLHRLIELGGEQLGAVASHPGGIKVATLRDPFGAVLALRASTQRPLASPVAWHQLHTRDVERARSTYCELLGWTSTGSFDAKGPEGEHHLFAWDGGQAVGSIVNTARLPGIHTHWLYYFRVFDLDAAIAKVTAAGGQTLAGPSRLPSGDRLVPCADPQGGAFGLFGAASS